MDKEIIEIINNAKPYNPTLNEGIFYCKGREDMKEEIISLINGEQHRQNGYDNYGKQVLKDIRELIKEIK